ncbi:MAG: molecular chaperone HscC [Xanthomonadaceae bacterium]|jgi:molecular chaperone HscC|nr:molecular chaperone HscC [Xanthomonadaceae bacterium]
MAPCIGIDLGTTNSLAGLHRDGGTRLFPNALGSALTPSCVSLLDGKIVVGQAALDRLHTHPESSAGLFKRIMGTERHLTLDGQQYRPEELSSFVLRALKADAEAALGETIEEAVITVPAYFSDAQRKATKAAGALAGLRVECLLNEPTAAALAYGLQDMPSDSQFLVFDLGGGTFDISVLDWFEGVMEVRASAGDNFLGGEDFNTALMEHCLAQWKIPLDAVMRDRYSWQRLNSAVERAKRKLSASSRDEGAQVEWEWEGAPVNCVVTPDEFAHVVQPLLDRLRTPIERALRDSRIRPSELSHVVLAGGATRMPLIRKLVAQLFGKIPTMHINPDEVVAVGAAVQACLKSDKRNVQELVLTDVCPYTLGVDTTVRINGRHVAGYFSPIIERNTPVPVSRVESYWTISEQQKVMHFEIFQGESRFIEDNIRIGEIRIPIPPRDAGEICVEVRFTYDVSGILECEFHVPVTGERTRLIIEQNPGVMSEEDIARRFAELSVIKLHPREEARNVALMARAKRLYEQELGERREFIAHLIASFEGALDSQDRQEILEVGHTLSDYLDEMEANGYF